VSGPRFIAQWVRSSTGVSGKIVGKNQ
jgi:hypothetical protein